MQRQPVTESQRERIAASVPFVEALARRVAASMPHSIDLGDLVQDGMLGLIDAAHRYDEDRGIKFETFAERRVRGAMIDALRRDAWPRGVRRMRRQLESAREDLRRELGCEPSMADLAARMGSDEARLNRTIVRINTIESTSPLASNDAADEHMLPAVMLPPETPSPDRVYETTEVKERVRAAIDSLPPRERRIIGLYYFGEVTMKQIGAEIGVNESRVSQLHARAVQRLKKVLAADRRPARRDRRHHDGHRQEADGAGVARRDADAGHRVGRDRLPEHVAREPQQVGEPERLRQPPAAALFEEASGLGAGDVARDEYDAPRQRRRADGDGPVERRAVELRHPQVADHQVVLGLARLRERHLAVMGLIDAESRVGQGIGHRRRQARLVIHQQHAGATAHIARQRRGLGRGRAHAASRRRQLEEERRPVSRRRLHADAPAVLLHDRVGDRQAEPGALPDLLGREERVEDPRHRIFRHPRPIVVQLEHDDVAVGVLP